jgi:hypothetical protein
MSDPPEPAGYELERAVVKPELPGEVCVRASDHDAVGALAADLLLHAHNCVRAFGDFHLCVSGDGAVEPALLRLLTDPAHRDLPWRRTHLWPFAERLDPGPGAEYDLIHETIAIHADLPKEQTHRIDTARPDAAAHYERELRETLAWREKGHDRLDYALLSPTSPPARWGDSEDPESALVRSYTDRVACTRRLVNASRLISVLALGDRPSIERIGGSRHALSALAPVGGSLRWYLDEAACPMA